MKKIFHIGDQDIALESVQLSAGSVKFTLHGVAYHFRAHTLPDSTQILEQEPSPGVWQRTRMQTIKTGPHSKQVQVGALEASISEALPGAAPAAAGALSPRSPMPGLVRQIMVKVGDIVKTGQPIALMEAMKLQITLTAGGKGVVEKILVKEGDMIAEGIELVTIRAETA